MASRMMLDNIKSERRYGIEVVEVPKMIITKREEINGRYIPKDFIIVKKYIPIRIVIQKKDTLKSICEQNNRDL